MLNFHDLDMECKGRLYIGFQILPTATSQLCEIKIVFILQLY